MVDTFLVGGALRDRLLGIEPDERDWVVTGATPEEMQALGYRPLDAEFPVFTHPETGEEYALARRERKTGAGHKGFAVDSGPDVALEEDLRRRDLRINAMAESATGELIDPFNGRTDLEARILRHVSPAFAEDPLRVLRAARFSARFAGLGFDIDPSTRKLMRTMSASGDMRALSGGRIWREIDKALVTDHPSRFFSELEACGALSVLVPEFSPANDGNEIADALQILQIAAARDPRPDLRFATLVNACAGVDPGATTLLLDHLCQRLPVPRKITDLARIVPLLYRTPSLTDAKRLYSSLESVDAFRRTGRFSDALAVCDALSGEATGARQADVFRRAYDAAATVSAEEVVRSGARGEEAGEELKRRRIHAIESSLKLPSR